MKLTHSTLAAGMLMLLGATSEAAPTFVNGLTLDGDMRDASGGALVNDGRLGFFSDIYYDPFAAIGGPYPIAARAAARSTTRCACTGSRST